MPSILVAPDSFKGTFSARSVAEAMAGGIERVGLRADRCPVADGGEGTAAAMLSAWGGQEITVAAHDPLGRPIEATFALLSNGQTAVVEAAAASGLDLVAPAERDPWGASTYGTGELMRAALDTGAAQILVASGGSATVDGGLGALRALAERPGGIGDAQITVLCDVNTTWESCARTFGPQKGADGDLICRLERRLATLAARLPRNPSYVSRSGAAGGLSGALWAVHGAMLESGASRVLDAVGFEDRLAEAIAVVVGEGKLDSQSVDGKLVGEVAARARARHLPVHAIVGRCDLDENSRRALHLTSTREATTLDAIADSAERVAIEFRATERE